MNGKIAAAGLLFALTFAISIADAQRLPRVYSGGSQVQGRSTYTPAPKATPSKTEQQPKAEPEEGTASDVVKSTDSVTKTPAKGGIPATAPSAGKSDPTATTTKVETGTDKKTPPAAAKPPAGKQVKNPFQVVKASDTVHNVPGNLKGTFDSNDRYMGYPFYGGNNYLSSKVYNVKTQFDIGSTVKDTTGSVQTVKIGTQEYATRDGYFFQKTGKDTYKVVKPPLGAQIDQVPSGAMRTGGSLYFNGSYYVQEGNKYKVVKAPKGAIVPYLSNEAKATQKANGATTIKDGDTVYAPYYFPGNQGYIIKYKVVN